MQREDGSYVGTDSANNVVAISPSGGLLWQQFVSTDPLSAKYATADDGAIVTTSTPEPYSGEYSSPPTLGTLFTLDQHGNVTASTSDTGAKYSWTGQWYVDPAGTLSSIFDSTIQFARTFVALAGGNNSGNDTSIWQVVSNEPPGLAEQLPTAGATLRSNYNSIEIITTQSPDAIFSGFIQTYNGIRTPNNTVVTVTSPLVVTGSGQDITFQMLGPLGFLGSLPLANCTNIPGIVIHCPVQGPFLVRTERFDPAAHTISAVTLQGHPIAWWRYWRVFSPVTNDVVVETGAVDTHGPGPLNTAGYYWLQGIQLKSWQQ